MSLITLKFFIFLCVTFGLYYLLPKSYQWIVLLSASIFFYLCASPYYMIFLLISAASTYLTGLALYKERKKTYLIICLVINVGLLLLVKYVHGFIFPLGISFYTFMVISYIVDVYRGETEPQTNFLKYLLFVSYFPQIIEGPINIYSKMKDSLYAAHDFDFERCKRAGYRILIGLFKKTVIAGRFSVYVDNVYQDLGGFGGLTLFCTIVFYMIQLYADFSGCMDIVLGISELFGITMEENFDLPFFSKNAAEVWKRWHISLGVWFRNYVYEPVLKSSFSKNLKSKLSKTKLKKYSMNIVAAISLAVVWVLTGIWHGDSMKFLLYGVYWGAIIIFSTFLSRTYKKMHKKFPKLFNSKWYSIFAIARTLVIICVGFTIFRADTVRQAVFIFKKIFTDFSISRASIGEALLPFTYDNTALSYGIISFAAVFAMFIAETLEYNKIDMFKKHKYLNAAALIVVTLLFGIFGQSDFLYMRY